MIQDEIVPSFKAGMSFSLGGQQYIMSSCVKDDIGMNSSEIECYEVTCLESNEKRCLRTERTQKNKKIGEGFDFIKREADVLIKIQSEQGGLKYFGKGNVMDVNSCFRSCIIVEMPICTLNSLFQDHLEQLELSDRISLSMAAIEAYSVFLKKNITWSEEITFSSVVLLSENRIGIVSGLNTCEIQEKTLGRSSVEMGYTFKKNCAQIKAIALGILSNDKDLASKHATPYNLQQFVGRVISKNKQLTKLAQAYSNYPKIFQCFGFEELEAFLNYAGPQNVESTNLQENNFEKSGDKKQKELEILVTQKHENSASKSNLGVDSQLPPNYQGQKSPDSPYKAETQSSLNSDLVGNIDKEFQNENYFAISKFPQKQLKSKSGNLADSMKKLEVEINAQDKINIQEKVQVGLNKISGASTDDNAYQSSQNGEITDQEVVLSDLQKVEIVENNEMEGRIAEQSNQLKIQQAQLDQLRRMLQKREQEEKKRRNNANLNAKEQTLKNSRNNSNNSSQKIESLQEESEEEEEDEDEQDQGEEEGKNDLDEIDDIESQDASKRRILKLSYNNYSSQNSNNNITKPRKIQNKHDPTHQTISPIEDATQQRDQRNYCNINHKGDSSAQPKTRRNPNNKNPSSPSKVKQEENKEEDQIGSSGSNGITRRLSDNLLGILGGRIPTHEQFLSDRRIVRILGGLLVAFIIFCIIFGAAFNFGVKKHISSTITCDDTNCASCPEFPDTCGTCKANYYLSSKTGECVHKCSVSNCETCITDYAVCEVCNDGYVLALSACYPSALSCPVNNCKSCKDLTCIECDFGYKLSGGVCIKKCTQAICATCDLQDPSICLACSSSYTLDASTSQCS